jgi:tetratricopeptide (TPR) repeat protein
MRHRTIRHLLVCTTLLSALAVAPREALAEESAAGHAKKGQVAFDLQDWATAAAEFEAAYRLEQKAGYLWSLAQAQRLSGKYAEAIRSYKAFQRLDVSTNQANAAEMMVTKCEAEIAKQEAQQAQTANTKGESANTEPAPATQPAEYDSGQSSGGGLGIGWFLTGASLTVALGATSAWSYLDMQSKRTEYEDAPTRARYDDGKDSERRTNILLVATGAVAIGTAVLAVFTDWGGDSGQPERRGVRVRPAVGTNGGALFVTGAF